MRILIENGEVFEADRDAANQIYAFDYQQGGFSTMFFDFQQLRKQGRKLYNDADFRTRTATIPIPPNERLVLD